MEQSKTQIDRAEDGNHIWRVAGVSYLNTRPLVYGFRSHPVRKQMVLIEDYPARIAQQLIHDEIDIGLIPVAIIPELPNAYVISNYCIGAEGPVASVCIFSDVPITEVRQLYLDYQSRSSVRLARLLLERYWHLNPALIPAEPGFEDQIQGQTAAVVIGDRALKLRHRHAYIYDLAQVWIEYSGLPFVFAAWVANKPLPEAFIRAFDEATSLGLQPGHLDAVIAAHSFPDFDVKTYFTQHISYSLTDEKRKGMLRFLHEIHSTTPVHFLIGTVSV
ncbi:menaquinone biosynthetic enzyme MqnA/MqnD family protein [Thermoflavifilum thermophilum]|uniref:Chorismate dehydratase n=1 Tax=Thermoflavifilum thermophilum TaxID=1393122 RepID=A0A1I7N108_9BACT|nr:menaquinone biosynthesis protein [Thermoflavifilum thermophilum]SFV28266.1 chorismate dehydratase [Thermoflavifilum thermophilum]